VVDDGAGRHALGPTVNNRRYDHGTWSEGFDPLRLINPVLQNDNRRSGVAQCLQPGLRTGRVLGLGCHEYPRDRLLKCRIGHDLNRHCAPLAGLFEDQALDGRADAQRDLMAGFL